MMDYETSRRTPGQHCLGVESVTPVSFSEYLQTEGIDGTTEGPAYLAP